MLVLALLPLALAPQKPPKPFAILTAQTRMIATTPTSPRAAVVTGSTAWLLDAANETKQELPLAGDVVCVSLGGDTSFSLGLENGTIVHVDANSQRTEHRVSAKRQVQGLQRHGNLLGWYCIDSTAGVLDLATGKQLFAAPLTVSIHIQYPALRFTADGSHLLTRVEANHQYAQTGIAVYSLREGAETARMRCYSSMADELVVAGSRVVHADRLETKTWNLLAHDTATKSTVVLDESLRGGHYVDLFASPSGRYVVEGDFEEKGIVRYDLAAEPVARLEFAESVRAIGCGVVRIDGSEVEVVFGADRKEADDLVALRLDDGSRVSVLLPRVPASRLEGAGSFSGGRAMWVRRFTGTGAALALRTEFYALDSEAKGR